MTMRTPELFTGLWRHAASTSDVALIGDSVRTAGGAAGGTAEDVEAGSMSTTTLELPEVVGGVARPSPAAASAPLVAAALRAADVLVRGGRRAPSTPAIAPNQTSDVDYNVSQKTSLM